MSSSNSVKGKRAPPPLPMYQPVVLKHVPTMVRRRYEHFDVNHLDQHQDVPTNDGESEEDGYLDASDEDELEDMGPGIGSSEPEDAADCNPSELEHLPCIVDGCYVKAEQDSELESEGGVSVEWKRSGEMNSTDDCETGMYSSCVSNEIIQPTDLHSECSSEDDGSKVANHDPVVDSDLEEKTLDNRLTELKNEFGDSIGKDNGVGDAMTSSYTSLKDEALRAMEGNPMNEEDFPSQYSESEDDGTEVANYAPVVDSNLDANGSKDKIFSKSSTIQDCKDEDNKAGDAKTANYSGLKYETLNIIEGNYVNGQELHSDDNIGEYDDAEDESPSFCANMRANSEVEEMGHGSLAGTLDTLTQINNRDLSSQNFVRSRGLDLEDFKSDGDRTNDKRGATDPKDSQVKTELQNEAYRSSNAEEFNPDDFKKTVEDDGYELCCPYCKHCITKTLLYQRRENSQECRMTCFTGLFTLFCCIRD